MTKHNTVDEYLAGLPDAARVPLQKLRTDIKSIVPEAEELISYGMPAFKYKNRRLAYYAAFKDHCSLFPASKAIIEAYQQKLDQYKTAKGTIQFPLGQLFPTELLKEIVLARKAEIDLS